MLKLSLGVRITNSVRANLAKELARGVEVKRLLDAGLVADPLLWLDGARGIALEAHQQNVVVELEGGWPAGCRYRDNQGYYFKASRAERLRALLPDLNRSSDTICDDAVA